jgi:glycosyltransferase involved in cell wall biosynthesis
MLESGKAEPQDPPRVSTVIPCHDGERYVAEAIRSALAQPCTPHQVIVVDDGSSDRSPEIVRSFGGAVRLERQPRGGAARARNLGAGLATGRYLAFLDADDLWVPDTLPRLLAVLEADRSLGIAFGKMQQFVSPELPPESRLQFRFSPEPVPARLCGSVLVRRDVFARVGALSAELASGEFIDWLSRAEHLGVRAAAVDALVLRRRLHHWNHGVVRRDANLDYLRVVKAALDRRRSAAST